jgi:adenylosuccinate lyase
MRYLDVEATLARARARLGLKPAAAAVEIERHYPFRKYRFRQT